MPRSDGSQAESGGRQFLGPTTISEMKLMTRKESQCRELRSAVCQVGGKSKRKTSKGHQEDKAGRKTCQNLETQAGLPVSGVYMVAVCNDLGLCCRWDVGCLPKAVSSRLGFQVAALWGRGNMGSLVRGNPSQTGA